MSLFTRRVIVPPYWGVPSLSHQFPLTAVVVAVVETIVEVVAIVVVVEAADVVLVVDVADVIMDVDVVDVEQDASNIATSRKLKLNQKTLFFNLFLHFNYS